MVYGENSGINYKGVLRPFKTLANLRRNTIYFALVYGENSRINGKSGIYSDVNDIGPN